MAHLMRTYSAGLLLAFATLAAPSYAQLTPSAGEPLDCLIEPHEVIEVASPVQGIIHEIFVDRGDRVSVGQVIATLESGVEQASVDLARARAESEVGINSSRERHEFEKRKHDRARKLSRDRVVSEAALDEAETNSNLTLMALQEARFEKRIAELELQRALEVLRMRTIKSPADGIVVRRSLSKGEYAHEQSTLVTIAAVNPLNVEVFVPIGMFGRIEPGMTADVQPEEPIGGRHTAEVRVVDSVFDAASGTFGVRLTLPNPDHRLPAGIRCKVRFAHAGN